MGGFKTCREFRTIIYEKPIRVVHLLRQKVFQKIQQRGGVRLQIKKFLTFFHPPKNPCRWDTWTFKFASSESISQGMIDFLGAV